MKEALGDLRKQVMWTRLISIVEEQAQTLMRTAFSTTVRDAGDLSAALFDTRGRLIAEAVTGTPGHVNSMAAGVCHQTSADRLVQDVLHWPDPSPEAIAAFMAAHSGGTARTLAAVAPLLRP